MNKTRDEIIEIARENAGRIYRDLSIYKINAIIEGENWRVDFELTDKTMDGGGPHYIISSEGKMISKRYEQ